MKSSIAINSLARWMIRLAVLPGLGGCGSDFDSQDRVKTLRVLAVRKDPPYAAPAAYPAAPTDVELTMLSHDGSRRFDEPVRPIERLWFSGCDDLPGDIYFTCLARISALWKLYTAKHAPDSLQPGDSWSPVDDLPATLSDDERSQAIMALVSQVNANIPPSLGEAYLKAYRIGSGERFTYPIPPLIVENHPPSSDSAVPPYGLSFIFFTACAGHIDLSPDWNDLNLNDKLNDASRGFPFLCKDDQGNALGPDDFVAGYTQQFVYGDGTANRNPVIEGVNFDGQPAVADAYCVGNDCVPQGTRDLCSITGVPHVPACSGKCPKYEFRPLLDPAKNDDLDLFASGGSNSIGEQMWIDYYSDRGTLEHTVRNLRDAKLGWFDDHADSWTPPADAGPVNLWAVVHDNRGGTDWLRLSVCVE